MILFPHMRSATGGSSFGTRTGPRGILYVVAIVIRHEPDNEHDRYSDDSKSEREHDRPHFIGD